MAEQLPVKKTMAATDLRNNLGKLLNRVHRREEYLVVEKLGIPVAVIISMRDYEQYQRLLAESLLNQLGRSVGAEAERQGLTEEQLIEELKETRRALFDETCGELSE